MSEDTITEGVGVAEDEKDEAKRPRKLIKSTSKEDMSVEIEVVGSDDGPTVYPLTDLTQDIIDMLALHGLSQKLGDAAAGKEGDGAKSSIAETWINLKEGKFKGERASGERMPSKKAMADLISKLPPAEQETAKAALAKLNIVL